MRASALAKNERRLDWWIQSEQSSLDCGMRYIHVQSSIRPRFKLSTSTIYFSS